MADNTPDNQEEIVPPVDPDIENPSTEDEDFDIEEDDFDDEDDESEDDEDSEEDEKTE